jgi:TetR/AcrR family transcriptional regulator, transcriptional repressor for nem operon
MKRIHNKDDVIQIGVDLVLSKGFTATGIETILKQANIPKGSFYNFFSSKEEFGIAIINRYAEQVGEVLQPIMMDDSLPPLDRIRKCFEGLIAVFENNDCYKGCLIGNMSLEMSDQFEMIRQRLEIVLQRWIKGCSDLILEAQKKKEISSDLDPEMLAESLISSFQGALLRAKVKKSAAPLKNFIYLYFERFLVQSGEEG